MKLDERIIEWIYFKAPFRPAYRWPLHYLYCPCGCGLSRWRARQKDGGK